MIGGILQSCKSYDDYRPTKKDQKAIIENWLTTRYKVLKNVENKDTLKILFIEKTKIKEILEKRKGSPVSLKERDSIFYYEKFFNGKPKIKKNKINKNEFKKKGIVLLKELKEKHNKIKIDSMSYPLFSQNGKEAILYGSSISKIISQIITFKKREDGKWMMIDVFSFY
ncbi:hypothetical protein [Aquimarina rhabdastrellae]